MSIRKELITKIVGDNEKLVDIFDDHLHEIKVDIGETEFCYLMAQLQHESGLNPQVENTGYTEARARQIWGSRVPDDWAWEGVASPDMQEALISKVYGGRMGNYSEGDGWLYRGRGFIQITGHDNYRDFAKSVGIPSAKGAVDLFDDNPLVFSVKSALWYWTKRVPYQKIVQESVSIMAKVTKITRAINGGTWGLDDRIRHTNHNIKKLIDLDRRDT